jgi:CRISPR-associated protein Csm2
MYDTGNRSKNNSEDNNSTKLSAKDWFNKYPFFKDWITKEADTKMINYAESAGRFMANEGLTNSKIRSIYGEIKRIQMGNFEDNKASFLLLRPKVAYAYGREKQNRGLELFKLVFDEASKYVNDQITFNKFANFFEAILAYHKAYGGKD